RPLPTPNGVAAVPKVGSCVPNPVVSGEPMSSPEEPPGPISWQDPGVVRPACAQVIGIIRLMAVPSPGKVSSLLAILPAGAWLKNCGASAQVLLVFTVELRKV